MCAGLVMNCKMKRQVLLGMSLFPDSKEFCSHVRKAYDSPQSIIENKAEKIIFLRTMEEILALVNFFIFYLTRQSIQKQIIILPELIERVLHDHMRWWVQL